MQNVDLDNLDSEQLFKIKDKYQLMDKKEVEQLYSSFYTSSKKGNPNTGKMGVNVGVMARTPGKSVNIFGGLYENSRLYDPGDGQAKYRPPIIPTEMHEALHRMDIPFISEHRMYPDTMMESLIAGGKETLRMINNVQLLPQDGVPNEHLLPEEFRLQLIDSRYTAEWMYPTNFMVTQVPEDEINQDHEQFNLNFNTYRKSKGRCKLELKIGNVYILELGKKEKRLKEMTLAKMENINRSISPMLYFTENYNWYGGTWKDSALMNVSILKIKESSKEHNTYAREKY